MNHRSPILFLTLTILLVTFRVVALDLDKSDDDDISSSKQSSSTSLSSSSSSSSSSPSSSSSASSEISQFEAEEDASNAVDADTTAATTTTTTTTTITTTTTTTNNNNNDNYGHKIISNNRSNKNTNASSHNNNNNNNNNNKNDDTDSNNNHNKTNILLSPRFNQNTYESKNRKIRRSQKTPNKPVSILIHTHRTSPIAMGPIGVDNYPPDTHTHGSDNNNNNNNQTSTHMSSTTTTIKHTTDANHGRYVSTTTATTKFPFTKHPTTPISTIAITTTHANNNNNTNNNKNLTTTTKHPITRHSTTPITLNADTTTTAATTIITTADNNNNNNNNNNSSSKSATTKNPITKYSTTPICLNTETAIATTTATTNNNKNNNNNNTTTENTSVDNFTTPSFQNTATTPPPTTVTTATTTKTYYTTPTKHNNTWYATIATTTTTNNNNSSSITTKNAITNHSTTQLFQNTSATTTTTTSTTTAATTTISNSTPAETKNTRNTTTPTTTTKNNVNNANSSVTNTRTITATTADTSSDTTSPTKTNGYATTITTTAITTTNNTNKTIPNSIIPSIIITTTNNNNTNNSNNVTNSTSTITTATTSVSEDTTSTTPTNQFPIQITIVTLEAPKIVPNGTVNTLPKIQPVMEMAIERVNELYDGRINFTLIAKAGSCTPEVGVAAARISCRHNISAFIGTACSDAVETLAYMANTWNIPFIAPVANTENIGDKYTFPRLTRINLFMQVSIVNTVLHLAKMYGWTKIAMYYDAGWKGSWLFERSFDIRMKKSVTLIINDMSDFNDDLDKYEQSLKNAAQRARIFLLLNLKISYLVQFLHVAAKLGFTQNGDFVWLHALGGPHPQRNSVFHPSRYHELPRPISQRIIDLAKELDMPFQQRQALFFHINMDNARLPKVFKDTLIERSEKFGIYYCNDYPRCWMPSPPSVYMGYWDAVHIYATCINETLAEGGDPFDGLAVTRKMWNRTFEGLDGPIVIDESGDRDSEVSISGWNEDIGKYQTFALMAPKTGGLRFQHGMTAFPWPLSKGKAPKNEPVCGYLGVDCTDHDSDTKTIVIVTSLVVIALIIVGVIIVTVLYRRSKKHGEQDLLWWLIQGHELLQTSTRASCGLSSIFTSKSSLKDINHGGDPSTPTAGYNNNNADHLALYKGQIVRVQRLEIKQVKLTNELLHEFRQVREMSHTNLNRIYGATVDDCSVRLVMENCPKGTLQDLLGSDHVQLDAQFRYSLTMDIIDGLCYIHGSPLKWHGRLTSEVCLVDNRFSVKIASYGLPSLHGQVELDMTSQEWKNGCLWMSPEMLRATSHTGSKESDIYSLGIVLSEIVTRDGPFGQEVVYMTLDEILHKISTPLPGAPAFRPSVEVPLKLSYTQDVMDMCWKEDPKYRPSATDIRAVMKKFGSQFCAKGSLIDNLMSRMEQYANNLEILVEEKTEELREEKKRSEELLYQMLPRSVADRLKLGLQIQPENYDSVTIYFSDIVGFTCISARSTPIEVVTLLNDLYSLFDGILGAYDVYKVETIGDAYMVVSGLPSRNGYMHACHIANMTLDLLCGIKNFTIPHLVGEKVKLRIGLHSGPVCAGVVGLKMPRYCLFGDTVNTASRMESHGQELKIHVSYECKAILDRCGHFDTEERGPIDIKGKGQMVTFWLTGVKAPNQGQVPGQVPK